jgi:hypothetical protein
MNFAGGGIIAFADGGDVERYQFGGDTMGGFTPDFAQAELMGGASAMRAQEAQRAKTLAELEQRVAFLTNAGAPQAAAARAQLEAFKASGQSSLPTAAAPAAAPAADNLSGMDRRLMAGSQPNIPSFRTPLPPKAAPTADTTRKAPGAGLGAAAAAATPKEDPFSMASIRKAQDDVLKESRYQIGALNNQLVEIKNKAETQLQQRLEDRKKEIQAEGDVYKDRSDRLVERAKGLASQKNENAGLAFLNAGLAIMSTPGGLMTAIGKGAQVGTTQYAAGIKDLRAAQERLDEANDRISELRMNRKDLNSREIRALEKDRDNAILDGQKMLFGFAKDVYGMDRKQAEAAFTSYMSGQEKKADIQSRENVARITTAPALERNAMLKLAESKDAKVRAEYGKLQAKVMDTLNKDDNYKMAKPAEQQLMQTNALRQALMNNPFLSEYAANVGFSKTPSGTGKVYDLTGE